MDKLEFLTPGTIGQQTVSRGDTGSVSRQETAEGVEPIDPDDVERAVERINEGNQLVRRDLEFSVNDDYGRIMVRVMDSDTQEVIREIPPEKLLAVAQSLEEIRGLLFDAEA